MRFWESLRKQTRRDLKIGTGGRLLWEPLSLCLPVYNACLHCIGNRKTLLNNHYCKHCNLVRYSITLHFNIGWVSVLMLIMTNLVGCFVNYRIIITAQVFLAYKMNGVRIALDHE